MFKAIPQIVPLWFWLGGGGGVSKTLLCSVYFFCWRTLCDLLGPINDQMSLFEQFCIKKLSCKYWQFCCRGSSGKYYFFFRSYPFYCRFLYHHLFDLHLINSDPNNHVLCQLFMKIGHMYPKKKAKSLQLYTRTTGEKRISLTSIGLIKNFLKCIIYNLCSLTGA